MIISIDEIEEGMELAEPVFSRTGQVLLNEGASLGERHKKIFKNRGISMVAVRGDEDEEIAISDDDRTEAKYKYVQRMVDPPTHSLEKEISALAIERLAEVIAREKKEA